MIVNTLIAEPEAGLTKAPAASKHLIVIDGAEALETEALGAFWISIVETPERPELGLWQEPIATKDTK